VLIGTLLASVASGCGPYIQEVNEQHRQKLQAKLEQIQKLEAVVKATPLQERELPTKAKISLTSFPEIGAPGNATLVYAEDFANLDQIGFVTARVRTANLVPTCSAGLHTERTPWSPDYPSSTPSGLSGYKAEDDYAACERLEYVFVVRTRALAKPELLPVGPSLDIGPSDAGADGEAGSDAGPLEGGTPDAGSPKRLKSTKLGRGRLDAGLLDAGSDAALDAGVDAEAGAAATVPHRYRFRGGYLDAEVLVFELAGTRLVGSFRFQAESSAKVEGHEKGSEVEEDFARQIGAALAEAANRNMPGSVRLPADGGS